APEAAIGAKAEIGNVFPRGRDPPLETRHIVNGAEIDPCAARLEFLEWREEGIIAAVEHGNVNEVHAPPREGNESVRELHGLSEIGRGKARPAAKRTEAEVIAERHVGRNVRR